MLFSIFVYDLHSSQHYQDENSSPGQENIAQEEAFDFSEVFVPPGWVNFSVDKNRMHLCEMSTSGPIIFLMKAVSIRFLDKTISFQMMTNELPRPDNPSHFTNMDELNRIVKKFAEEEMCPGIKNSTYNNIKYMSTGKQTADGTWKAHM